MQEHFDQKQISNMQKLNENKEMQLWNSSLAQKESECKLFKKIQNLKTQKENRKLIEQRRQQQANEQLQQKEWSKALLAYQHQHMRDKELLDS